MQKISGATVTTETGWEQELGDFLAELTTVQSELLSVLNSKREAVARGDIEAVDALRPRAEQLLDQLQTFQDRRAHMLESAAEQGLPSSSLSKLATHAAPTHRSKLGKQVKESAARMRLVQHECLANWVLAQRSLLHISQMLEIIATGGR